MRPERSQGAGRALVPGSRIGDHTVLRRLARGGMAEVYLAHERTAAGLERFVALKVILPQMAGEQTFISMFLREARVSAALQHANIAQMLAAGEEEGEPFLVMEYVHGETVQALLRSLNSETPRLPLGPALSIMLGSCAGLHYAHERRDLHGQPLHLVHRDVSPSNLMVRFDGTIKVLDFGIAKAASQTTATATGVFKGKQGYMSPEQCADEPLDRRSDVFNLGILLYELTTGRRAFFGDNPLALINKIANGRYARPRELDPDYPVELENIIERALALEPDERIPSAAALAQLLEVFAHDRGLLVSTSETAAMMARQFGERPYPSLADLPAPTTFADSEPGATPDAETVASDVAVLSARRPRTFALLGGLGLATTLGAAAWALTNPATLDPSATHSAAATGPSTDAPAPEAAPAPLASTDEPIAAEVKVVEQPTTAPAKRATKRRRKSKKKRTKKIRSSHTVTEKEKEYFYP